MSAPGIGFHDEEDGTAGILSVLRGMQAEGQLDYTGDYPCTEQYSYSLPAQCIRHPFDLIQADSVAHLLHSPTDRSLACAGRLHGVHRLDKVTSGCLILVRKSMQIKREANPIWVVCFRTSLIIQCFMRKICMVVQWRCAPRVRKVIPAFSPGKERRCSR